MANPVTHFEIAGGDPAALHSFYHDAFGWQVKPSGPTYAMVHPNADGGINGGVGAAPEGGGASRVTVYVQVGDIEQVLAQIEKLGGRRVLGPVDVQNGPTIALFADPEGHVIGLTEAATVRSR